MIVLEQVQCDFMFEHRDDAVQEMACNMVSLPSSYRNMDSDAWWGWYVSVAKPHIPPYLD